MTHRLPAGHSYAASSSGDDDRSPGAESILLTDPDGAVTRVAPWSTWTREQRRAPGGEPSLLTRLDEGQLWFSAGSPGSPWRHEVNIGPAVVSTPRGRFHAIAEDDGGATIACLAGRTRVSTAFREPVLLEADQTVAVSSDGETLVVINRMPQPGPIPASLAPSEPSNKRSRMPEVASMVALVALLIGAAFVFGRGLLSRDLVATPVAFSQPPGNEGRPDGPVAVEPTLPIVDAGSSDVADLPTPATPIAPIPADPEPAGPAQVAPVTAAPGTATGRLVGCRRSAAGVVATVDVRHRSGGADRFTVDVALVDRAGTAFATGSTRSPVIEPSSSFTVDVAIDADTPSRGACELTGIAAA